MNKYTEKDYLKILGDKHHDMFVPFDVVDSGLMGTLPKGFVMCKGKHLGKLYESLHGNPSCNFITCMGESIHNISRSDFDDLNISVVIKTARYDDNAFTASEVTGSRIAEILGVKTPYIDYVGDDKSRIMCVDFLSKGLEQTTFSDIMFLKPIGRNSTVGEWIEEFLKFKFYERGLKNISEEKTSELIEDIFRAFVVRRFLIEDNDMNSGNIALIHNKDYSRVQLISYDYEFCFNNDLKVVYITPEDAFERSEMRQKFLNRNLLWMAKNYPKETESVMRGLQLNELQRHRIDKTFDEYSATPEVIEYWKYHLNSNIERVLDTYDRIMDNESVM
jgi:hypothetical protein